MWKVDSRPRVGMAPGRQMPSFSPFRINQSQTPCHCLSPSILPVVGSLEHSSYEKYFKLIPIVSRDFPS